MSVSRFLAPQEETHAQALREIRAGQKVTHWIWWEMPQLACLGRSERARAYGLADLSEAQAYLRHPVLGPRLSEMCEALLAHADKSATDILGDIDALKVRSMATLFSRVPEASPVFSDIIEAFYDGRPCDLTLTALDESK